MTKKGMKELKKELFHLEQERKNALSQLRNMDRLDNHDERLARVEVLTTIESIEAELAEKNDLLLRAKILPRKRDALTVAIGSIVDLIDTSGKIVRYTLVESFEANPSDGRISIKSPLGKKLIGRKIKDMVEWSAGLRTNTLQLVSIR